MATPLATWLRRLGVEAPFAALADLVGGAVFAVDAERNIVHWSPGAAALLGFTAAETLGAHCLKGFRCATCIAGCGVAEHRTLDDVPLVCHTAEGAPLRVRKSARAFYDADGTFAGAIEWLRPERGAPVPEPAGESFHGLVSRDPEMLRVFATVRNVAETEATVLVRGESGTGKELVARAIHDESHRRDGPYVAVNCAAFTPSLLESELFGHVKGAFTGATHDRDGIFAQADGGTLFLDEVAELTPELQSKLLRVLETRTFTPVGGRKPVQVDVRVVAATHKALREEVKAGRFREDLLYRLRVVPIFLPPLRARVGDVDLLLERLIAEANAHGPRRVERLHPDTLVRLRAWSWPGNVRELRNVVQYMFAVGRGLELTPECLPPELRADPVPAVAPAPAPTVAIVPTPASPAPLPARGLPDVATVRAALEASHGHIGDAADRLGVSRPTLWRWRRKLGL